MADARPQPTPDEVVRELKHLPSTPRVLPRLKRLLGDANSSLQEIVRLIRLDPGIAARVLHTGNSAYYGQGTRCYTVDEAVQRVGYNRIYELVAHAVASQVLVRPLEVYGLESDELWQQSIACALGAELLAERAGVDRDVAYTVGLLHAVGMVAIDEWAFREGAGLRFLSSGLPLEYCEAERATFGFHQGEAGAALLRLWDFPTVMSEPVRWQYLPCGTSTHHPLAVIVHIAKWLRTAACQPEAGTVPPDRTLLQFLRLSPAHLGRIAAEVQDRLNSLSSLLSVPPDQSVTFPNAVRPIVDTGRQRPVEDGGAENPPAHRLSSA